jgi:hypothetical protein
MAGLKAVVDLLASGKIGEGVVRAAFVLASLILPKDIFKRDPKSEVSA